MIRKSDKKLKDRTKEDKIGKNEEVEIAKKILEECTNIL